MSLHIDQDRIHQEIELKASRARVWRALTDYREFSEWFGVNLESPFAVGQKTRGRMTVTGHENTMMEVEVQKIESETLFSFTWHPYAIDPAVDYSQEPPTLVEFRLTEKGDRTLLSVTESGFAKIPAHRRAEAFRMNDRGWSIQLKDIAEHVGAKS